MMQRQPLALEQYPVCRKAELLACYCLLPAAGIMLSCSVNLHLVQITALPAALVLLDASSGQTLALAIMEWSPHSITSQS